MTFNPATWPEDEVAASLSRGQRIEGFNPMDGRGGNGIVVGSTGPFGQYVGRQVLQEGGNAMDAAVATSFAQIALAAGCWVSYAGLFTCVYFEAATGQVHSVSGPFRTFKNETDGATIPRQPEGSGRTALVPGFFAGAGAAHERFGRAGWADLLEPAIWLAKNGFPIDKFLPRTMEQRRDVLLRTPEGRAIFAPDGDFARAGDSFRQPQLAETLEAVAAAGVNYLYRGPWAEKFVEIVQREGGKVTAEDLATYEAQWGDPLVGHFRGHDIYGNAAPVWGGSTLIENLHLVELAGLGDPQTSAEALYWYIQIARQGGNLTMVPPATRATREHADRLWKLMADADGVVGMMDVVAGSHSDFVVTADSGGNVAAVCHSINTGMWGTTGIFVDGISIPDAASFQQALLALVTPGDYLPTPPNPTIALKDGKVALASSSIGSGLPEVTLQCVAAVLSGQADVVEAANRPAFHGAEYLTGDSITSDVKVVTDGEPDDREKGISADAVDKMIQGVEKLIADEIAAGVSPMDAMQAVLKKSGQVIEATYDADVIAAAQARGIKLRVLPGDDPRVPRGHWGGIQPDADGGWKGARTPFASGVVEAY